MASSINEFKNNIVKRGGLAKANRFEVHITLPTTLAEDRGRDLTLLCESTILPGKLITSFEWSAYGHSVKIPTNFIQEDVTCAFNVTNDYYVKRLFDRWQSLVIDPNAFLLNYDDAYRLDIDIKQLDEQDKVIYEMKLLGAYPISVGPIALDNNSDNLTQRLVVTFSYNDYRQT